MNDLETILLSETEGKEITGYDLTKLIPSKGWRASHQQIYRSLRKMADLGYVNCRYQKQDGKPDKKLYTITRAGRKALQEAKTVEPVIDKVQDHATTQAFIGNVDYFIRLATELAERIESLTSKLSNKEELEPLERIAARRSIARFTSDKDWALDVARELQESAVAC